MIDCREIEFRTKEIEFSKEIEFKGIEFKGIEFSKGTEFGPETKTKQIAKARIC